MRNHSGPRSRGPIRFIRVVVRALATVALTAATTRALAQAPRDPRAPMPERPTVATHAYTVAPGFVEIEAGGEADRNRDRSSAWLAPLYVKVGLSARAQLGVLGTLAHPTGRGAAFGDLALAMKYRLADGVPLIGTFAVQPGVKLPTGDADHGTRTSDVSVLLIGSRAVGSVALDVNAGYTRRSGDGTRAPRDATLWTLSAGIPLPKGVGIAAELFGMPGTRGPAGAAPTVAMLAGPTFPLGAHGVLDVGGIVRVAGPQPDALYAGVTYNVGRLW